LRKKKIGKVKVAEIGEKEYALVKKIAEFPDAVEKAATSYEPHTIAEYAYTLAQIFNEFYHAEKVIGSEHEAFRLALVAAFAQVLKSASRTCASVRMISRGRPVARSRPRRAFESGSSSGSTAPIPIFVSSAVFSPMASWNSLRT
jgi:hypothetical protein